MIGAPIFRYALTPGWAGDRLTRAAQAVPSLDLNFAVTKNVGPLVSFTRASTATYIDSAGTLQTAAVDVPRFDHNPTTGESLGLLVEEARTNSIRNNTMVGAVAGTPGTVPTNWNDLPTSNGLSRQIVGVGTQLGITYIEIRYSGTTTAAASTVIQPELGSQTVAATGQSWTASSWLSLVGGSTSGLTVVQRITGRSSVGGFLENTDTSVSLTGTLTRYAASIALANVLTARVSCDIAFSYASGAAIDITFRIGLPQLEQGAFATSVIPTTTAAATRNADVASITGSAFSSWYRQDEGTMFAFSSSYGATNSSRRIAFASDGTTANRFGLLYNNSNNPQIVVASAGTLTAIPSVALTGATYAIAAAYKLDDYAISAAGSAPSTDTSGALPVSINQLSIGNQLNGEFLNGTIKRLTYWPQRLPNSTLQAITQ
jgi:hypothetical protein